MKPFKHSWTLKIYTEYQAHKLHKYMYFITVIIKGIHNARSERSLHFCSCIKYAKFGALFEDIVQYPNMSLFKIG